MIKSIFDCSKKEIKQILKTLDKKEKARFLNERGRFGHNALHKAPYDKFKLLVENGIDINNTDYDGGPIYYSDAKKLNLLIEHGVNVNKLKISDENALFYIKSLERAKILINAGCNVNQINKIGYSPIFRVEPEILSFFLENGANTQQINHDGKNVLFYSTHKTIHLLIKYGADIHQINNKKENLLFYYTHLGDYKNLAYLIKQGVNILQKNKNNDYFLHKMKDKDIEILFEELNIPPIQLEEKPSQKTLLSYILSKLEQQKLIDNFSGNTNNSHQKRL